MRFEVTILGSNSAKPENGRHPSAQVLNIQEQLLLIDCGEGTQMQMDAFKVRRSRIKHIFISHLHGDHIFGLPGLLTSFSLMERQDPVVIFSPKGLQKIIDTIISCSGSVLSYPIEFVEVDTTRSYRVFENEVFEVFSVPLIHRVPTSGYLFKEKPRPRAIMAGAIETHHIPYEQIPDIKAGADFVMPNGRIIPNKDITTAPPVCRSYAYCSDTIYSESVIPIIRDIDLLYHEATYLHERLDRAVYTKHSTARQAAQIAKAANVKQLIIGHYSSRYKDVQPLLEEAKLVFENTFLAEEGKTFEI